MSKTKELIICIISIIALVLAITTNAFATEAGTLDELLENSNTENNTFEEITENNTNVQKNISAVTQNNITNNVANNTNTNATIPYTGIDYSVIVIIAICGISAVYAYKKIREYNV